MSKSITVRFNNDEWLPVTRDGRDYLLHFSYVDSKLFDKPEEEFYSKNGRIVIGISGTLQAIWGYQNANLRKVLFGYGKRHVENMISEGALVEQTEIQLTSTNAPQKCPFDPVRINLSFNKPFEVKLPLENPLVSAKSASLAFQIVDLRDSINAIFGEKYKGRILTLPQERHLIELFKDCDRHEDFAYRVASLSALATAIDGKFLKTILKHDLNKDEAKSLDLIGKFLRSRYPDEKANQILDVLQNFNQLRRMYPIHTDRARGVLKAHRFFCIDYPISDHKNAWQLLLQKYRNTLGSLLDLLKS